MHETWSGWEQAFASATEEPEEPDVFSSLGNEFDKEDWIW
jgi:hypothetical protein